MKKMGGRDKGNKRLLCICIASSAFWQKERKKDDLSHLKLKSDCTLHRGIRGLITKAEISPSELRPLNRKGQIRPLKIRKRQQQMRNSHRILQGCICVLKGSSSIFFKQNAPIYNGQTSERKQFSIEINGSEEWAWSWKDLAIRLAFDWWIDFLSVAAVVQPGICHTSSERVIEGFKALPPPPRRCRSVGTLSHMSEQDWKEYYWKRCLVERTPEAFCKKWCSWDSTQFRSWIRKRNLRNIIIDVTALFDIMASTFQVV